ncbi:hypothetical protein [Streptomyces niveus]|uniref:hypothetical protein n=1 Tax=Streptomyces niveus TaxID=193462 RepID=UPI00368B4B5D
MSSTIEAAAVWLAAADPDPAHAQRWIGASRIILLPLGKRWSAVKVNGHDGLAAAAAVSGPSIHDPAGQCVFFLVPPRTIWDVAGTECLGEDCWLTVPTPRVTEPPGPHWLFPPDGSGRLVNADDLRAQLNARRTPAESIPPDEADFVALLDHTGSCPACNTRQRCGVGENLRATVREDRLTERATAGNTISARILAAAEEADS